MTKISRRTKLQFTLLRTKNFLITFGKNRRGMLGVLILVFFTFVALGAPLITPYHPTSDVDLSGQYNSPVWMKYFPGSGNLSENFDAVVQSAFDTPDSLTKWNISTKTTNPAQNIEIQQISGIGNPYNSGPGSLAITYKRGQTGRGTATVTISQEFFYPHAGAPRYFYGLIALRVEGNGQSMQSLYVPIKITVFIQRIGGEKWTVWPPVTPNILPPDPFTPKGEIGIVTPTWVLPKSSPFSSASHIDSRSAQMNQLMFQPLETIFNASYLPSSYAYGTQIEFNDLNYPNNEVETTVYIDDLYLKTYGTAFGLLGTDHYGRDIFSQLIYGTRISLYVGLLSAILSVVIGLIVGLASGYLGGIADEVMMRATDMLLVLPGLPLLIVLMAVLGSNLNIIIILLGFLGWMGFARIVRSQVLTLKERPFIEAAKALGAGKTYITTRHIIPNVMSLVYVTLATTVPGNIVAEAALSWLGFYDPSVMSWGRMLHDVQNVAGAIYNWWWVVPPGLAIALVAIAFILIGYALDDILNPKLRLRR